MCEDEAPDRAALYRYDPDGTLTTVLEPVSLSNGLGWAAGEQRMYYVDSPTKRVDVLDYDPETGEVADRRPFALIEDGVGVPDGLAIDVEDGVWVALYGGAQVRRYGPGGTLDAVLAPPGRQRDRRARSAARTGAACSSPPRAPRSRSAAACSPPSRASPARPPGSSRHDHDHRRPRARHPLPHLAGPARLRRDEPRPRLLGRLRRPRAPTTASRATASRSRSGAATSCASRRSRRSRRACRASTSTRSRADPGDVLAPRHRRQPAALARAREGRHPPRDGGGRQRGLGPVGAAPRASRCGGCSPTCRPSELVALRRLPLPDRRARPRARRASCSRSAPRRAPRAARSWSATASPPTRPRPAGSATPTTRSAGSPARRSPRAGATSR